MIHTLENDQLRVKIAGRTETKESTLQLTAVLSE